MNMNYRTNIFMVYPQYGGKLLILSWHVYVMTAVRPAVSPSMQWVYPLMRFVGRARCEWQQTLGISEIASSEKENYIGRGII